MKTERAMIYSRLVEGRFPNYKQVVPQEARPSGADHGRPVHDRGRQAAIMTDDESKRVRFTVRQEEADAAGAGVESGQSRSNCRSSTTARELEISFDPKFLIDMLRVLEPDTPLMLDMNDSGSPAVFRHEPNYLYVVVPLVETTK